MSLRSWPQRNVLKNSIWLEKTVPLTTKNPKKNQKEKYGKTKKNPEKLKSKNKEIFNKRNPRCL